MGINLSTAALQALNSCDIAKSLTGETPEQGTTCWVYNMDDSGKFHKKCEKCPYFNELQAPCKIAMADTANSTIITLSGNVNDAALPELKKTIDKHTPNDKPIAFDCGAVLSMCSGALGLLLRVFKTRKERQQLFFLISPSGPMLELLRSTMLIKVMPTIRDHSEIETISKKRSEERETGELQRKMADEKKRLEEAAALRCWEYFKGQHPKNATACAVCYYKNSASKRPCWVVVGSVDGIEFDYIDEDCLDCEYFQKLNPDLDVIQI